MRPKNKWVKVWFARRPGKTASVRRLVTQTYWDHVALELNSYIAEVDVDSGVVFRTKTTFEDRYPDRSLVVVRVTDSEAMSRFVRTQITKPAYDKPQWMPIGTPRTLEGWNPATFVATALTIGGSTLSWPDLPMSPSRLWLCMPLLTISSTSS